LVKKRVKPTSVRLDNELLEELDQRCEKLGCSRNDFINGSIELLVRDSTNFDFGDEEMNETKVPEKPQVKITLVEKDEPKPTPIIAHGKILDDYGNVIGTF